MAHGHEHAAAGHGHDHAHGDEHVHHDHFWVYMRVFGGLMILLIITLVAAAYDLGAANLPIAMAIAVAKALIVVMYFMHVKWSSSLVRTFAAGTMLWLLIMFVMTLMDYLSRGMTQPFGR
jgi:cytochrome c oxidase subunit IV